MAYAVNTELRDRLGTSTAAQLTSETGTTPDLAVLTDMIEGAEGTVNSYLADRYEVPIDVTTHSELSAMMKQYTIDLAVWRTYNLRPPVPEHATDLRDKTLEVLRDISKGVAHLPSAVKVDSTTSDAPVAEFGHNERLASRANMGGL